METAVSRHEELVQRSVAMIDLWTMKFTDTTTLLKASSDILLLSDALTGTVKTTTALYDTKLRMLRDSFLVGIKNELNQCKETRTNLHLVKERLQNLAQDYENIQVTQTIAHQNYETIQRNHNDLVHRQEVSRTKLKLLHDNILRLSAIVQHIDKDYEYADEQVQTIEAQINELHNQRNDAERDH